MAPTACGEKERDRGEEGEREEKEACSFIDICMYDGTCATTLLFATENNLNISL
jgi:hypothetical protein